MKLLACAALCAMAAASPAWAHTGSVHVSDAWVSGPNEITVLYSDLFGSDQGCSDCAGASYSDLVLFPGGARSVVSVSESGNSHTVSFDGPAAAVDAEARFHVYEAAWTGGGHEHRMQDASASAGDGQPPSLLSAHLNLDAGTALLKFDEPVGRLDAPLVKAAGIALSGEPILDGGEARLDLGEQERSGLSALREIQVTAEAGAFQDAAGNASARAQLGAGVTPDRTPPEAAWFESALDLGAGTLTLVFTEHIDASSIDPAAVSVGDAEGARKVSLEGASVDADGYADRVVLKLTGPQKAAATDPEFEDVRLRPVSAFPRPSAGQVLDTVRIDSGARDAAGLGIAGGAQGGKVRVVPDAEPPGVIGAPVLDLGDGSLRIKFDEHIDAYGADVGGMRLSSGEWGADLSVEIPGSDGYELVVFVGQEARLSAPGSGFELGIGEGAVSDLSGNPLPARSLQVEARPDAQPPRLVHAYINAASGVLTAEFDEPLGRLAPAYLSLLEEGHSSHRVRMYASAPYEIEGNSARITLTQPQKLDVSSFRTAAVLEMSAGAARDLAGNPAERGSVRASVSGDSRPPEPQSASLDAGTGLLAISFDEPMDPSPGSVDLEALSLRSGGAAIPLQTPSVSASVSAIKGHDVSIRLDERQRQWVISHGAPLWLKLDPGSARDASANPVGAQHVLGVETDAADVLGPSLESASLDMGSGLLTIEFTERVEKLDAAGLALLGPSGSEQNLSGAQALPADGASSPVQLTLEQRSAVSDWHELSLRADAGAAEDTSGNASPAGTAQVERLRDRVPPSMVSASISGPDRISVRFSEDLHDPSVSASDFEVGGSAVAGASEDGGIVTLTVQERIRSSDGKSLRVELVGNVADENGNLARTSGEPPYVDAPNDLLFAGAESFTIESDNALSPEYARAGDTITVKMKTDAAIDSASVTVNSNEADVESGSRSLVAKYAVSADDEDGPADVSVTIHSAGERGGTSSFGPSDASGSVSIDNAAPEYASASLAGSNSLYVHYSEPVRTEATQYTGIAVGDGGAGPAVYVAGSGTPDILVEWDGARAGPNSPDVSFEIDDSVSDLAGNLLSNPGEQSMTPPASAEALALLRVSGDGRVALAHDTFVETVSAPGGAAVDVADFGPPTLADPAVDAAGGSAVQFPPKSIVIDTDRSRVTFPPGVQAGGFSGDPVIVARVSDAEPDEEFALANPGIRAGAAVVLEFGSPGEDIELSLPAFIEFKDLIKKESVVFSIDSDGHTRELLECSAGVNPETAAGYIASDVRPLGSGKVEGGACVDKEAGAVWAVSLMPFGAAVPAAAVPDCDGDCTPPTFGVSASGNRIVSDGFAYNGRATDVDLFFTPSPASTAEVGHTNTAVLKIYDDSGPDAIEHVGLAFGLREGQSISESLVEISWDRDRAGRAQTTLFDPAGVLDPASVGADASEVPCSPGSSDTCLRLEILHSFQSSPEFDMVGTDAWDWAGNEWQNFYNHAVHVEGDPGDPDGISVNGGALVLYRIGAGTDVLSDRAGFLYKLSPDGAYMPLTNSSSLYREIDDSWRAHEGHEDRREGAFRDAVEAQALAAQAIADRITGGSVSNPEFGSAAAVQFFEEHHGSRADDAALQDALLSEQQRAAELARLLFGDTG